LLLGLESSAVKDLCDSASLQQLKPCTLMPAWLQGPDGHLSGAMCLFTAMFLFTAMCLLTA
jgi:hypothetical protein